MFLLQALKSELDTKMQEFRNGAFLPCPVRLLSGSRALKQAAKHSNGIHTRRPCGRARRVWLSCCQMPHCVRACESAGDGVAAGLGSLSFAKMPGR